MNVRPKTIRTAVRDEIVPLYTSPAKAAATKTSAGITVYGPRYRLWISSQLGKVDSACVLFESLMCCAEEGTSESHESFARSCDQLPGSRHARYLLDGPGLCPARHGSSLTGSRFAPRRER